MYSWISPAVTGYFVTCIIVEVQKTIIPLYIICIGKLEVASLSRCVILLHCFAPNPIYSSCPLAMS